MQARSPIKASVAQKEGMCSNAVCAGKCTYFTKKVFDIVSLKARFGEGVVRVSPDWFGRVEKLQIMFKGC
jgi:hypothetical protein